MEVRLSVRRIYSLNVLCCTRLDVYKRQLKITPGQMGNMKGLIYIEGLTEKQVRQRLSHAKIIRTNTVFIINGNIQSSEMEVIQSISSFTASEHIPKGIIPIVENTENIITTSASHNKITA